MAAKKRYQSTLTIAEGRPVSAGKHPQKGTGRAVPGNALRAAALQDKVNELQRLLGDTVPVDEFGSEQQIGHMQYWQGVPLIFDSTLDGIHPDFHRPIRHWLALAGPVYEALNDSNTNSQVEETLWVEAIVQVYNAHPRDIFQVGEHENPGYRLLKDRAFKKHSIPAIYHLQSLLSSYWHEKLAEYCTPGCQTKDSCILQLQHIAEMNVRIDSLFRQTEGYHPTFWRPQMEDLANNRFLVWEEFIRVQSIPPTGDQDTWTLPTEAGYSLEAERRAYELIYQQLQLQRQTYLAGFVATGNINQERANELAAQVEAVPDGPLEQFYRPSAVPDDSDDDVMEIPYLTWKIKDVEEYRMMREDLRHRAKTWEDSLIVLPGQQRPAKKKRSEVFKMLKWQLPELVKKPVSVTEERLRANIIQAAQEMRPVQPVLQDDDPYVNTRDVPVPDEPDNDFWEED